MVIMVTNSYDDNCNDDLDYNGDYYDNDSNRCR